MNIIDVLRSLLHSAEDALVCAALVVLLGVLLILIQRPGFWTPKTGVQRSRQMLVMGLVVAISSSMTNIVQYNIGSVNQDRYLGLLIGSLISGFLVAAVDGITESAKNRFLLACFIGSLLAFTVIMTLMVI
jgi:hypothetical protein